MPKAKTKKTQKRDVRVVRLEGGDLLILQRPKTVDAKKRAWRRRAAQLAPVGG
jgi:hypothetical protein